MHCDSSLKPCSGYKTQQNENPAVTDTVTLLTSGDKCKQREREREKYKSIETAQKSAMKDIMTERKLDIQKRGKLNNSTDTNSTVQQRTSTRKEERGNTKSGYKDRGRECRQEKKRGV